MATTSVKSENMFCVCHKDTVTGKRIFLNYISDSREKTSIKLPDFMVNLSQQPEDELNEHLENVRNMQKIDSSIECSLSALYGNSMPRIYVAEKSAKDLVANVYIHEAHSKALTTIPFKSAAKRWFLGANLRVIQERVLKIVEDPEAAIKLRFNLELDGKMRATGRSATKEEICAVLLGPIEFEASDERQIRHLPSGSSTIRPNERLLCICMRDFQAKRSAYYNIIASDHPRAIRLPEIMVRMSRLSKIEAWSLANSMPARYVHNLVGIQVTECLEQLYEQQEPDVYLACGCNNKDLVFMVPVRKDEAHMLSKSLLGEVKCGFFGSITDFYRRYFFNKCDRRANLRPNENMQPIDFYSNFQETSRPATEEEIYSLILNGTPRQYSLCELDLMFS